MGPESWRHPEGKSEARQSLEGHSSWYTGTHTQTHIKSPASHILSQTDTDRNFKIISYLSAIDWYPVIHEGSSAVQKQMQAFPQGTMDTDIIHREPRCTFEACLCFPLTCQEKLPGMTVA